MEFPFIVNSVLKERITTLRGREKRRVVNGHNNDNELMTIINDMGVASAKAQGLKTPITVYARFLQSPDQCIYILKDSELSQGNGSVLGFIKTGRRRLFLTDQMALLHEVEPLSILDFYVHESQQRRGHGKVLFEHVLQEEGLEPFEVAIDRPSVKFLSFLRKHYNLTSHIKQNNNFVVFDKFFTTCSHIDYGRGHMTHRRYSLPVQTERRNHAPPRMSLSPKRTQWYSTSSSPKLAPLREVSLTPPTEPNGTPPAKPVSITSLTSSNDSSAVSVLKASPSPWDLSKLNQLKTTPTSDSIAPHLNMRSNYGGGRNKGAWFDSSNWRCGTNRYPTTQYSRYNCDRLERNNYHQPNVSTNISSLLSHDSRTSSNTTISQTSWKDYLH